MAQDQWPAEWLSHTLRALNRTFMKKSQHPHLRGRESWPNQQPELFADEFALATRFNVKPLGPNDQGFKELLDKGQRFNWAILLDGSLRVSPSIVTTEDGPIRISHALLCYNGQDVLAAGEGRAGEYLSNTTGHYKNDEFVVAPVKEAFAKLGIRFKE